MGKVTTKVFYAAVAVILSAGFAHADIVGSIWENVTLNWQTGCACAVPANVPTTTPNVTFDISGTTTINLSNGTDPITGYTIGAFLNSEMTNVGGSTMTVLTGSGELGNTLNDIILNITGTVPVTTNQTFLSGSDDGLTLTIGSTTVVNNPGEHGFSVTQGTYPGLPGTVPFQLVYGECCNPPAQVLVEGLDFVSPPANTPLPAALPLFATGIGGLGLIGWHRKRKARAVT